MEKDDAIFYALHKMGHQCPQAIMTHPNPLTKRVESTWLVEVEHDHNDLGKHGDYTFWYKITDDPKNAEWGCRKGPNELDPSVRKRLNGSSSKYELHWP